MSDPVLLSVRGVRAGWGRGDVLADLDLSVAAGEIVGILGGNGSGKSTLLAALSGLLRPAAGEIELDGRSILGLPAEQLARRGVRLLAQARRVFPSLTVAENLAAPELAVGRPDPQQLRAGVARWLELFPELAGRRGDRAAALSGGQQQLLALGRVVSTAPRLLLLDEPSAGLAGALETRVADVLRGLAHSGTGIVLVEQDLRFARALAGRTLHLRQGCLARGQGGGGEKTSVAL